MPEKKIALDFQNQTFEAIRYFQIEHAQIQGALANDEQKIEEQLGRPMNEIEDVDFLLSHRKEFTRMGLLDRIIQGILLQTRNKT